jgi:hypothetical protein
MSPALLRNRLVLSIEPVSSRVFSTYPACGCATKCNCSFPTEMTYSEEFSAGLAMEYKNNKAKSVTNPEQNVFRIFFSIPQNANIRATLVWFFWTILLCL